MADSLAVLIILLVAGLLISIKQWPEWARRLRSANWPTTTGMVETGEVSTHRGRARTYQAYEDASATLGYSYNLNGIYYSGYHIETFDDEQKAWSYVDALKGQAVQVRYNPRKPEVSVLGRQPLNLR